MSVRAALLCAFVALIPSPVRTQDMTGDWQATLRGNRPLRLLLQVAKADSGLKSCLVSLDEGGSDQPFPASTIHLEDSVLTVTFAQTRATYRGKLGAGGKTLIGTWTQTRATPLNFERATSETAWRDP